MDVRLWHKADMLNALTNVRIWGQSGHGPTAAYQSRFMSTRPRQMPRHAANEIKQAGIGKRLGSGGSSGSPEKSMRSATQNVSASAPTLTINTASS